VILIVSGIVLSKMSPKEKPLIENWLFKEKIEKQFGLWMKKLKPKTSNKVTRKAGQNLALIIEGEKTTRQLIRRCLESERFMVIEAENGAEGLLLAALNYPEVILLDSELPDMEGSLVLNRFREWTQTPVIILTADSNGDENLERQNTDHNYYLTKPFAAGELKNLMSVVLRHLHHNNERKNESVFETPIFKLDRGTRVLTVRKKEVHLTPHEHHLLTFLINHAGQVVTLKMVNHEFWGRHIDEDGLRHYIHQLRYKIEYDPVMPKYILTEPGLGYRLKHR
jgi:two-component system KDP operon response regulator KdpE